MTPYDPQRMQYVQQQVVTFHGRQSAEMVRMAPNSSLLGMDDTAPIVWLCVTDSVGRLTVTPYDVSPHVEPVPVDPMMHDLQKRMDHIEKVIEKVEAMLNEQSNVRNAGSSATNATPAANYAISDEQPKS